MPVGGLLSVLASNDDGAWLFFGASMVLDLAEVVSTRSPVEDD